MTLDEARAALPAFGFAVYAMDPGGPVMIEVYMPGGEILSVSAATEPEAWDLVLPPPEPLPSIFD